MLPNMSMLDYTLFEFFQLEAHRSVYYQIVTDAIKGEKWGVLGERGAENAQMKETGGM